MVVKESKGNEEERDGTVRETPQGQDLRTMLQAIVARSDEHDKAIAEIRQAIQEIAKALQGGQQQQAPHQNGNMGDADKLMAFGQLAGQFFQPKNPMSDVFGAWLQGIIGQQANMMNAQSNFFNKLADNIFGGVAEKAAKKVTSSMMLE